MEQNEKFFIKILDDEQFKTALMEQMLMETYKKLNATVHKLIKIEKLISMITFGGG